MAGPLAAVSVAQVAQQKAPEAAQAANKQGPSKFDQAMKSQGTEQANGVNAVNKAEHVAQAQKIQQANKVDQLAKTEKTDLKKADHNLTGKGADPVAHKQEVSKSTGLINGMVSNIEKGQVQLEKLINGSLNGKDFSNSELLGLQAGMYKYSQELDLCSKVVEKATSGLKDTLKTQV